MLLYIGLVLVVLGWWIQFFSKGKELKVPALLVYCLGTACLGINGLLGGITLLGALETLSFVSALAVLIKIRK